MTTPRIYITKVEMIDTGKQPERYYIAVFTGIGQYWLMHKGEYFSYPHDLALEQVFKIGRRGSIDTENWTTKPPRGHFNVE